MNLLKKQEDFYCKITLLFVVIDRKKQAL